MKMGEVGHDSLKLGYYPSYVHFVSVMLANVKTDVKFGSLQLLCGLLRAHCMSTATPAIFYRY
jgi:hypothetical protein